MSKILKYGAVVVMLLSPLSAFAQATGGGGNGGGSGGGKSNSNPPCSTTQKEPCK